MKTYNKNLYPFNSRWITIDGNKVHYIDEGKGQIILFSHPPVASSFMYREFIQYLKKHYRCIAIDYPNFGLSSAIDSYKSSIVNQSNILEKFILKLNLQDICIMGHDTGGPSAFQVAADHPSLFNGLILTDTIIFPVSEYQRLSSMLGIVGSNIFSWINARTNLLVNGTYKYGIKTRKLTKEERLEYKHMFNTPKKRRQITIMLKNLKDSERLMNNVLSAFKTSLNTKPVLLIYGENDPVRKLGIADRIHKMLPNSALYLIDREGHFPHEGKPKQMSEIMHQWASSI